MEKDTFKGSWSGALLKICRNTVSALIRRCRTRHSTTVQSHSGCPSKIIPWTVHYLHNLSLENRQASALNLTQVINGDLTFCDS